MKLALQLINARNNTLYNEVLAKAAGHWMVQEKKRKALVKA